MQSLKEKAKAFIGHAKVHSVGSWKPFRELRPHLWDAIRSPGKDTLSFEEKCFAWDFLHVVAMTWLAVNSAKLELPETDFIEVSNILEKETRSWNHGASIGFFDLDKFIQEYMPKYKDSIKPPHDLLNFTIGTWLLWNLTNKAPLKDSAELANMLGNNVHASIAGYWKSF